MRGCDSRCCDSKCLQRSAGKRAGAASAVGTHIGECLYPVIQDCVRQLDLASRRHWRRRAQELVLARLAAARVPFTSPPERMKYTPSHHDRPGPLSFLSFVVCVSLYSIV